MSLGTFRRERSSVPRDIKERVIIVIMVRIKKKPVYKGKVPLKVIKTQRKTIGRNYGAGRIPGVRAVFKYARPPGKPSKDYHKRRQSAQKRSGFVRGFTRRSWKRHVFKSWYNS